MKKTTTSYVCQECGYDTPKFLGKCPECGSWNSLKQISVVSSQLSARSKKGTITDNSKPQKLGEVAYQENTRILTNFSEMNTVLGGGLVLGSATLLAGDPGVGKSTLLLQTCINLANDGRKILYISGEESAEQIKMRADRLQRFKKQDSRSKKGAAEINTGSEDNLFILATSDPDFAIEQIEEIKPDLTVLDSVQAMQSQNLEGLSGAVGQVRYTATQFIRSAKQNQIATIIVGHVTKEGMVAGPMVLSHMVDTVLFLEGEKFTNIRILRSLKNRFGPVDEVGIFGMDTEGMSDATHPEKLFLSESNQKAPGGVLVATQEGSRTFLVEIQALVVYSKLAMPRRVVSGLDRARVELLMAVLQKHAKLPLEQMDVFVNVAGGIRISDPAADLGVCLAVYSSLKNVILNSIVSIAEVGLQGELRMVSRLEKRVSEARKMQYNTVITAKTHKNIREVIANLSKST